MQTHPRNKLNRRQMLGFLGAAGTSAVALVACGSNNNTSSASSTASSTSSTNSASSSSTTATAAASTLTASMFDNATSCGLSPTETEGPYYIDVDKIRSDIREDRVGTRLRVGARVLDVDGCTPIKDAVFEVWHCDAAGIYSGFEAASTGQGGGGGATDSDRFLRGAQITNASGITEITSVYPGWYRGRTAHIHAKIFISNTQVLTTQLFFDEDLNSKVYATSPYNQHSGRDTFNNTDSIFSADTIMTVSKDGDGYLGLITLTVKT